MMLQNLPRHWMIGVALAAAGAAFVVWNTQTGSSGGLNSSNQLSFTQSTQAPRQLNDVWNWEKLASSSASSAEGAITSSGIFHVESLRHIIGKLQVQNDQVIINSMAGQLLESTFKKLGPGFTPEQLDELQILLKTILPQGIGDQISLIVGDYYHYKKAYKEMARDVGPTFDPTGSRDQFEDIATLQQTYLGVDAASGLFGRQNAFTRFAIEQSSILRNSNLNADQKSRQLAQLRADLEDGFLFFDNRNAPEIDDMWSQLSYVDPALSPELFEYVKTQTLQLIAARQPLHNTVERRDWDQRYYEYSQERELVLSASLGDEEKYQQLEQLSQKFFTTEELGTLQRLIPLE